MITEILIAFFMLVTYTTTIENAALNQIQERKFIEQQLRYEINLALAELSVYKTIFEVENMIKPKEMK